MSGFEGARGTWRDLRTELRPVVRTAGRAVFGDRVGLALFLAGAWVFVLSWRTGLFITDTKALADVFVSLAHGHLAVTHDVYFPASFQTDTGTAYAPGLYEIEGHVYGRNYGQLAAALPFLWALRALGSLVGYRLLLVVGWSLLPVAVAAQVGRLRGRYRTHLAVGLAAGLASLLVNLTARMRPVDPTTIPVLALQASTLVATGLTGVVLYRWLGAMHGRRAGLLAGATALVATPLWFWATIPKRHALVALLVVAAIYAFYRSRHPEATLGGQAWFDHTGYRALAYACAGLLAWVHALEGFLLFVSLLAVDLPTAPRTDARTLAVVAAVFALSLGPFLATNALIFGNPISPPRLADHGTALAAGSSAGEQSIAGQSSGVGTVATGSVKPGSDGGSGPVTGVLPTWLGDLFAPIEALLVPLIGLYVEATEKVVHQPDALVETFLRSGYLDWQWNETTTFLQPGTNLTVLESAPMLAGLAAIPGTLLARGRRDENGGVRAVVGNVPSVDWAVVVFTVLFGWLYMARLPTHAQVTVRYLHPLYPLALYGVVRQRPVRRALTRRTRTVLLAYATTAVVAVPAFLVASSVLAMGKGDVFQFHAQVSLLGAGLLAVAVAATTVDERVEWLAAVGFGLVAGLATALYLDAALVYFHYAQSAMPVVGALTGAIRLALVRLALG